MRRAGKIAVALAGLMLVSGCFGRAAAPETDMAETDLADVARAADGAVAPNAFAAAPALDSAMEDGTTSALIEGLLNRVSVLQPGPLRDVANAVMAANTRAAEAELRAAMLRSEAKSLNWLPQLGPQVSLTSLGSVVTSLVLNQAIVDHGARRAERDYAQADVEVSAVALAADSNARVLAALELYLAAEAALARAAVSEGGLERMAHFAYIMTERVNAGVSDRADLQVVTQRQDQMLADLAADREAASVALAELSAMADIAVDQMRGMSAIAAPSPTAVALNVMRAQAEGSRAVAGARAARAGYLPGVSVSGDIAEGGNGLGINVGAPNGLSFGAGAAIAAAEAEAEAIQARLGQEQETAAREVAALQGRLVSLRRQEGEARSLADAATANYTLFAAQQSAGQRAVPETVSVFETMIRSERAATGLRYQIAVTELRLAAYMGALVDGERM